MLKIGDIKYTLLGAKSLHDNITPSDDNRSLIQIVLDGTQEYLYNTLNIYNVVINDFISSEDEGVLDFALKSFGVAKIDYDNTNLTDRLEIKRNMLKREIAKLKPMMDAYDNAKGLPSGGVEKREDARSNELHFGVAENREDTAGVNYSLDHLLLFPEQ